MNIYENNTLTTHMNTNETKQRNTFYDVLLKGATVPFFPKITDHLEVDVSVVISPEEARYILQNYNNTPRLRNRKPSKVVVTKYSTDIKNGTWRKTGQTIQFSQEGDLMDGQQRLLSVIVADTPLEFMIVYGIERAGFDGIDGGKPRSYRDIVGMNGHSDTGILATLTRSVIAFEKTGTLDSRKKQFRSGGHNQITRSEILNYLEENPEIKDYIPRYQKNNLISPALAAFVYWILSKDNKDNAESYLDKTLLGYDLKENTIEAYVFNKLQRNRNAIQKKMEKQSIIANLIEGYRRVVGLSNNKSIQITWDARGGLPTLPFMLMD